MRKNAYQLLTFLLIAVWLLSACASPATTTAEPAKTEAVQPTAETPPPQAVEPTANTAPAASGNELILATTTSTQDSGLLDSLLPMFTRQTGIGVKPIAVGTGAALEMARRGDADAVLVHAPDAERDYVDRVREITRYGYVIKNSGDFVLQASIDMAELSLLPAVRSADAAALIVMVTEPSPAVGVK